MGSDTVVNLLNDPKTLGSLPDADVTGQVGIPGQGPFMTLYLKIQGDTIQEARFETYGCPNAIACGSYLTRWSVGRTAEQALLMEPDDLILLLGGLPLGKEHCASLAVNALRQALGQWSKRTKGTQP